MIKVQNSIFFFWTFKELYSHHHNQFSHIFITPKRNPTSTNSLCFPPARSPVLGNCLSFCLCRFVCSGPFIQGNKNEIIPYVAFCNCPLSLSIMFSRLINVILCVYQYFIFQHIIFYRVDMPWFCCLLLFLWMTFAYNGMYGSYVWLYRVLLSISRLTNIRVAPIFRLSRMLLWMFTCEFVSDTEQNCRV